MTEPTPSAPWLCCPDSEPFRLFVLFSLQNPIISETLQSRVGSPDEEYFITVVFSFEISLAVQLDACIHCVVGYTMHCGSESPQNASKIAYVLGDF